MVEMLCDELGFSRRDAKDIVESFFEEISATLAGNEAVKLSGFGNFEPRDKRPRPGRNPRTREDVEISARRVVTFHASLKLRALVDKARSPGGGAGPRER